MQKKDISITAKTANEKKPEERKFECVEYIDHLDNPKDFLDYLDIKDDKWGNGFTSPWIFRGQGNALWGLKPTAWRKHAYRLLQPIMMSLESSAEKRIMSTGHSENKFARDVLTQTGAIFDLTYQFVEMADELGFWIPGMEDVISGAEFISKGEWPSYWLTPGDKPSQAFGFAQHHSIPTQFLDWTRNPLVAAFFAADSCLKEARIEWETDGLPHKKPEKLAVWAINSDSICSEQKYSNVLRPLKCLRSQHSFLHVQDALFLWHQGGDQFYLRKGHWPDFLEVIEPLYSEGEPNPLKKISLPEASASQLLRLLYKSSLSKARLMPTYDNIAGTIKDTLFIKSLHKTLDQIAASLK